METAPKYRIWLNGNPEHDKFREHFPDGVPCRDFFKENDHNPKDRNFVFSLDFEAMTIDQAVCVFPWIDPTNTHIQLTNENYFYHISSTEVIKVIDGIGNECVPMILEESWILVKNARKFEKINMEVDGKAIHLLIMGLQQALFIEPIHELTINDLILPMAIDFIKRLSNGYYHVKEAYANGFSD